MLCLGKLMLFSFSLQLLWDEVLGSFFMLFHEGRVQQEFQAQREHGRAGWRAVPPPVLLPGDTTSPWGAASQATAGFYLTN